jgi:type IV pilus assembly protein PilV
LTQKSLAMTPNSARHGAKAKPRHPWRKRSPSSQGFVLIEVLIAGLIFTFGVLGIVGLQAQMTRSQTLSKYRADAVNLAQELVGVMWSSPSEVASFVSSCSGNTRCAPWQAKVERELPGATTNLQLDAGLVTIEIVWPTVNGQQRYSTQTQIIDPEA